MSNIHFPLASSPGLASFVWVPHSSRSAGLTVSRRSSQAASGAVETKASSCTSVELPSQKSFLTIGPTRDDFPELLEWSRHRATLSGGRNVGNGWQPAISRHGFGRSKNLKNLGGCRCNESIAAGIPVTRKAKNRRSAQPPLGSRHMPTTAANESAMSVQRTISCRCRVMRHE